MNLVMILRLLGRHIGLMLLCGATASALVFQMTKNEKKEYQTKTILNTGLVSGYNIESNSSTRIDYAFIGNEIENILSLIRSRQTLDELAENLLAQALIQRTASDSIITVTSLRKLQTQIPPSVHDEIVDYNSFENTLLKIKEWHNQHSDNIIKTLLESGDPLFGVESIEKNVTTKREGTTDMISITYTTTDPAVCRNTLVKLTEISIARHRSIKEGQTSNVLEFFQEATKESGDSLRNKEDGLLNFMVNNKIINYYEQTRFIAGKKEDLDEMYFSEMMKLAAADSARRTLEVQLKNRVSLPQLNQEIIKQREALSNVSARIAQLEIGLLDTFNTATEQNAAPDARKKIKADFVKNGDQNSLAALRQRSDQLKNSLRKSAESTFAAMRTPEGIEVKNMLTSWLNKWLEVEEILARLKVFKQRKEEFDQTYARFAPWGSRIKRLEREIGVAEKSYLENLHSYNVARMHKYNTMMSTNLRIVDPPQYPDNPKASKRTMLVVVAFLAGFILIFVFALTLELLDGTLRDPENAQKTVGLDLFTAFAKLPRRWEKNRKYDYGLIMDRSTEQLLQHIKIDLRTFTRTHIARIAFISTTDRDGKSFVASHMIEKLREKGNRVLYIRPQKDFQKVKNPHEDDRFYIVDHKLVDKEDEADLLPDENVGWHNFNYILTEMPALIHGNYPAKMFNQMDITLLVARANRTWTLADRRAVGIISRMTQNPCRLVLNATRVDLLENSIGEIPRRRSIIRRMIKKIARRDWHKNNMGSV